MEKQKRIGLIVPSSNTTMEKDFMKRFPFDKASLHISRMYIATTDRKSEEDMLSIYLPQAIKDLASADVDVIVFGCTSGGTLHGEGSENELQKMIYDLSGVRGITVTEAITSLMDENGIKKVALFSPYVQDLHESIEAWLNTIDRETSVSNGMGIQKNVDIGAVEPELIEKFVLDNLKKRDCMVSGDEKYTLKDADGIFISCTNFPSWDAVERIKEKVDTYITTSNKATYEYVMKEMGL